MSIPPKKVLLSVLHNIKLFFSCLLKKKKIWTYRSTEVWGPLCKCTEVWRLICKSKLIQGKGSFQSSSQFFPVNPLFKNCTDKKYTK